MSDLTPREMVLVEIMREMERTDENNDQPTDADYAADVCVRLARTFNFKWVEH